MSFSPGWQVARRLLADVAADAVNPDDAALRAELAQRNADAQAAGAAVAAVIGVLACIVFLFVAYTLWTRERFGLVILESDSDEVELRYVHYKYWWEKMEVWKMMLQFASEYVAGRPDEPNEETVMLTEERFRLFQSYAILRLPEGRGGGSASSVAPDDAEGNELGGEDESPLGMEMDAELVRPWLGEILEFYGEAEDAPVKVYLLGSTTADPGSILWELGKLPPGELLGYQLSPKTDHEVSQLRWRKFERAKLAVRMQVRLAAAVRKKKSPGEGASAP